LSYAGLLLFWGKPLNIVESGCFASTLANSTDKKPT